MADTTSDVTKSPPLQTSAPLNGSTKKQSLPQKLNKTRVMNQHLNRQVFGADSSQDLFVQTCQHSKSLYCRDLLAHFGCVNALEFSDDGYLFVSGSDDMRVLLWPISEVLTSSKTPKPIIMEAEHGSNIFCLAINPANSRIFSGGNDQRIIIHDLHTYYLLDLISFILP